VAVRELAVWRDELESSDGELGVGGLKDTVEAEGGVQWTPEDVDCKIKGLTSDVKGAKY
jgi:hypothetical protein